MVQWGGYGRHTEPEDRTDAHAAPEGDAVAQGLFRQVGLITRAIAGSGVGKVLVFLIIGLFLIVATAYGQIRLNAWNKPFYDAISRRDLHDFLRQLGVFAIIAFGLLVLNVAQKWLGEMLKLELRDRLLHDLVRDWMLPRRAFQLANAGAMGVNPDQRMHEDARNSASCRPTSAWDCCRRRFCSPHSPGLFIGAAIAKGQGEYFLGAVVVIKRESDRSPARDRRPAAVCDRQSRVRRTWDIYTWAPTNVRPRSSKRC